MIRFIILSLMMGSGLFAQNSTLQDSELEQMGIDLERQSLLQKAQQTTKENTEDVLQVAVLGNSAVDFETGFNKSVLIRLLAQIKAKNPKAVFFPGNILYALVAETSQKDASKIDLSVLPTIVGDDEWTQAGYFDLPTYEKRLQAFVSSIKEQLGSIPFYPVVGQMEALNPAVLEIFKKQFNLSDAKILETGQLVYSVQLENSLFAVIDTETFLNGKLQYKLAQETLQWLEKTLQDAGEEIIYKFVLGTAPAFSEKGTQGIFTGLDKYAEERDRFWALLRKLNVNAYVSGQDILYDRSYRFGVWQIVTGGAGATIPKEGRDETFYHFAWLAIPQKGDEEPGIHVFDLEGNERDDQPLTKDAPVISSFRISST